MVLARSSSSLGAITEGLVTFKEFKPIREITSQKVPKLPSAAHPSHINSSLV
jgi:hypothetical protein